MTEVRGIEYAHLLSQWRPTPELGEVSASLQIHERLEEEEWNRKGNLEKRKRRGKGEEEKMGMGAGRQPVLPTAYVEVTGIQYVELLYV